jgi:signal peptidase I
MINAVRTVRRLLDLALLLLVVTVAALVLAANLMPGLGHQLVIIRGGSMSPAIPFGALVDEVTVPLDQIQVGDVVSFKELNGVVVSHRVVAISNTEGGLYFRVQGDANASPDPDLVPSSAVTGKIVRSMPGFGFLMFMLTIPTGIASIFCLAVTLLMAIWLLEDVEESDGLRSGDPGEYESELARMLDRQRQRKLASSRP